MGRRAALVARSKGASCCFRLRDAVEFRCHGGQWFAENGDPVHMNIHGTAPGVGVLSKAWSGASTAASFGAARSCSPDISGEVRPIVRPAASAASTS
jgi:phage major head subunit gpT-like protein